MVVSSITGIAPRTIYHYSGVDSDDDHTTDIDHPPESITASEPEEDSSWVMGIIDFFAPSSPPSESDTSFACGGRTELWPVEDEDAEVVEEECQLNGPPRGPLSFSYQGWTTEEEAGLRLFLSRIVPFMDHYYGPPAYGNLVRIINNGCADGYYYSCGNKVFTYGMDCTAPLYTLVHEIAHAYHDDKIRYFEEGFATLLAYYATSSYAYTYGPDDFTPLFGRTDVPLAFMFYELNNQRDAQGDYREYFLPSVALAKIQAYFPSYMQDYNNIIYDLSDGSRLPCEVETALIEYPLPPYQFIEGKPIAEWLTTQYGLNMMRREGLSIYAHFSKLGMRSFALDAVLVNEVAALSSLDRSECYFGSPYSSNPVSGTAQVKTYDFSGSEIGSQEIEIINGHSTGTVLDPHTVESFQRGSLTVSLTTPEGLAGQRDFYVLLCPAGDDSCDLPRQTCILGLISGLRDEDLQSGIITVEAEVFRRGSSGSISLSESASYAQGSFFLDLNLSDYPSEYLSAEKVILHFSVKSSLDADPFFTAERIWVNPPSSFYVILSTEE
jgi:hypothetical protein